MLILCLFYVYLYKNHEKKIKINLFNLCSFYAYFMLIYIKIMKKN